MLGNFFSWLETAERMVTGDPKSPTVFREASDWLLVSSVLSAPEVRERLLRVLGNAAHGLKPEAPKAQPPELWDADVIQAAVRESGGADAVDDLDKRIVAARAARVGIALSPTAPEAFLVPEPVPTTVEAEKTSPAPSSEAPEHILASPPEHADVEVVLVEKHQQCALCLKRFAVVADGKCPECGHAGLKLQDGPVPDMSITKADFEPTVAETKPADAETAPPKKRGRPKKAAPISEATAANSTAAQLQQDIDAEDHEALRPPNPVPKHKPDPTTDFYTSELECDRCASDRIIVRVPPPLGRTEVTYRCLACNSTGALELDESEAKVLTDGRIVDYAELASQQTDGTGRVAKGKEAGSPTAVAPDQEAASAPAESKSEKTASAPKQRRSAKAQQKEQKSTEKVSNPMDAIQPTDAARQLVDEVLSEEGPEFCPDAALAETCEIVTAWPDAKIITEYERITEAKLDGTSVAPERRAELVRVIARSYVGMPVEVGGDENESTAA